MPRPHRVLVVWSLVLGLLGVCATTQAGARPTAPPLAPASLVAPSLGGGQAPTCPDGPTVRADLRTADADPGTVVPLGCTDPDGDAIAYVVEKAPDHGTLDVTDPAAPVYKPAVGYSGGPDSATYHANDGTLDSETRTVSFQVDQPPTCDPVPPATVDKNSATGVTVAVTCSDPEFDTRTLVVTSAPSHGTATVGAGQIAYTPAAGFSGTDTLTVVADDGHRGRSAPQTITVSVVNHAPTCTDATATTTQNTPVTVALACSDPDGDVVKVTPATVPSGSLSPAGEGASGSRTYTPDTGTFGTQTFGFTATDNDATPLTSAAAKVTVHVDRRPACAAPPATPLVVRAGTATPVAVTCTDADADPITFVVVTDGAHGTSVATAGGFTYTPTGDYAGPDQVTVAADDGIGRSDAVTIKLFVDHPPSCSVPSALRADFRAVASDPGTPIGLGCTDADGDKLTYTADFLGSGDTFDGTTDPPVFRPKPGSSGNATFTVTAVDAHGLASDPKPVTVLVDHPPTCAAVTTVSVDKNRTTATDIALDCKDADGDALTLSKTTGPARGTATISGATVSYTPDHGFSGNDPVTVVADDGHHGRSAPLAIPIKVVNHAPTCSDAEVITAQDTPVIVPLHCSDADGDALKLSLGAVSNGKVSPAPNAPGDYTFTPTTGYFSPPSIAFSFHAADDDASPMTSGAGTITLTVVKADTPPACPASPGLTVAKNGSVGFNPGCTDPDKGDSVTVSVTAPPAHGSLATPGPQSLPFAYSPAKGYTGSDAFTIVAHDIHGVASAPRTVNVTVGPDRAPSCPDRSATVAAGGAVPLTLACTDDDGDPLTFALVDAPKLGTATLSPAGELVYSAGEAGSDTLTYRAVDDQATASRPATVAVTVTPRAPAGGAGPAPDDGGGSRPISGGGGVVAPPPTATQRARALLGGSASPFDIGFGTKLKLWTADAPVAAGAPLAVLLCDGCRLTVAVTLNLSGLPATATTTTAGAATARPRKLVLAKQSVRGKGRETPVAVRLRLTAAQRALVRRARKATIALELAGTVAGRTRTAHRTMRASTTN